MNRKLFLIFFSLATLTLSGQKSSRYSKYLVAEFFLKDGSSFRGYYDGEMQKSSTLGTMLFDLNLTSFLYVTLDSEKNRKIEADQVNKIVFYNKDEVVKTMERILFKTVDKKGELSKNFSGNLEYLIYDGKIKLYSSNVFVCEGGGCRYTHTNFYIQKKGDPFAILAVKPVGKYALKFGSSIENTVDAFRIVSGDCTEFNKYLDFFDKTVIKEQKLDKKLKKDYIQLFIDTNRDVVSRKTTRLPFEEVADRIQDHQKKVFEGIIFEYEKNCK